MVIQTIRRRTGFVANFVFHDHSPHYFLAKPIFVVHMQTKMRVVENIGQLSNGMYKNMGLLTWETRCKYPIWSNMLRIFVLCKSVLNNNSINCLLSGDFIIAWKHELM